MDSRSELYLHWLHLRIFFLIYISIFLRIFSNVKSFWRLELLTSTYFFSCFLFFYKRTLSDSERKKKKYFKAYWEKERSHCLHYCSALAAIRHASPFDHAHPHARTPSAPWQPRVSSWHVRQGRAGGGSGTRALTADLCQCIWTSRGTWSCFVPCGVGKICACFFQCVISVTYYTERGFFSVFEVFHSYLRGQWSVYNNGAVKCWRSSSAEV